ncbi:MAG: hypothetical protein Q9219_005009 [cf. Caloplaca sp. 3 TL-2023]
MRLSDIVAAFFTGFPLVDALPSLPPIIRPSLTPSPSRPAVGSNPNLTSAGWPIPSEFVEVLGTELEFRVFVYGASRPPIPASQSQTIAQELWDIELPLRASTSTSLGWVQQYNTDHLIVQFTVPDYAGNKISPRQAADLLLQVQLWTLEFGPRDIGSGYLSLAHWWHMSPYYCYFSLFYAHPRLTAWPELAAYTRIPGRNFSFIVNNYGPDPIPASLNLSVANDLSRIEAQLARINSSTVPFNTAYQSGSVDIEFINIVTPPFLPVPKLHAISLVHYLRNLTLSFGPREIWAGGIQTSPEQYALFGLRIGPHPPMSDAIRRLSGQLKPPLGLKSEKS